jgi:hypothetical protein
MEAARALVERVGEHTYGVNTGFGRFVSESIPDDQVEELQLRLLRSHACGVGEPYPDEVIRAAMLLRANALAKGYSGARIETVELRSSSTAACYRGCRRAGRSGDGSRTARASGTPRGRGTAWFEGALLSGEEGRRRGARAGFRQGGARRSTGRNSWRRWRARARPRRRPGPQIWRALSRRCRIADELSPGDPRGTTPRGADPPRTCTSCSKAPVIESTAGATRCRTPTPAVRAPGARASRDRLAGVETRLRSSSTPRPTTARPRRRGDGRFERQLPRTAAASD